jgi:hypothetical protein
MQISRQRGSPSRPARPGRGSGSPWPRSCRTAPRSSPAGWSRCCTARAPRLVDRQLRAVPVRVAAMAGEQHAEFVDAPQISGPRIACIGCSCQLLPANSCIDSTASHRRDGRRSAPSAGTPPAPASRDGVVVGDRDRLAMRDQEAVEMAGLERRPGAHARRGARLRQVDRGAAAEVMALAVAREILLVRAPAQLGRLATLADEAVDRPGVDELVGLLGHRRPACRARRCARPSRRAARELRPLLAARGRRRATPVSAARFSSACLTKCETRPGFAPCVTMAVGAADSPLRSASASSRSA